MSPSLHSAPKKVDENDVEDPVESMLQKTGCIQLHYKIQVRFEAILTLVKVLLVFNMGEFLHAKIWRII
jgi:hypothetical protein